MVCRAEKFDVRFSVFLCVCWPCRPLAPSSPTPPSFLRASVCRFGKEGDAGGLNRSALLANCSCPFPSRQCVCYLDHFTTTLCHHHPSSFRATPHVRHREPAWCVVGRCFDSAGRLELVWRVSTPELNLHAQVSSFHPDILGR